MTRENLNKVKLLLALGWAVPRIANAIDASPATVKRYFRAELKARDAMRDRMDARRLEVAAEKAMTGNPSAIRIFNQMVETNDRMEATRNIAGRALTGAPPKPPKVEAPGKKAAKQTDAAAAIASDADLFGGPATKH